MNKNILVAILLVILVGLAVFFLRSSGKSSDNIQSLEQTIIALNATDTATATLSPTATNTATSTQTATNTATPTRTARATRTPTYTPSTTPTDAKTLIPESVIPIFTPISSQESYSLYNIPTPIPLDDEHKWGINIEKSFDTYVNPDWLNPTKDNARYWVSIQSRGSSRPNRTCDYTNSGQTYKLEVISRDYSVTIVDQVTGEEISQRTVNGFNYCPEVWTFREDDRSATTSSQMQGQVFERWLNMTMADLPHLTQIKTITATPLVALSGSKPLGGRAIQDGFVYADPNEDSFQLKTFSSQTPFEFVIWGQSEDREWLYVEFRGAKGWVERMDIEIIELGE